MAKENSLKIASVSLSLLVIALWSWIYFILENGEDIIIASVALILFHLLMIYVSYLRKNVLTWSIGVISVLFLVIPSNLSDIYSVWTILAYVTTVLFYIPFMMHAASDALRSIKRLRKIIS